MNAAIASELVQIVGRLGPHATFRQIWLEGKRHAVFGWHRTVRRYLDLLVAAGVVQVRRVQTKAPLPTELYRVTRRKPRVFAGLRCLQEYGLAWEDAATDLQPVATDIEGAVRGCLRRVRVKPILLASLEDGLVFELRRDAAAQTGHTELVAALLATRSVDVPYLLRRADQQSLGHAVRLLLRRLTSLFSTKPTVEDLAAYMVVRGAFLRLLRNYAGQGVDRLVARGGQGQVAVDIVQALSDDGILAAAGKQLGVRG